MSWSAVSFVSSSALNVKNENQTEEKFDYFLDDDFNRHNVMALP